MEKFIVRIELRNSQDSDYEELHKQLYVHGFVHIIDNSSPPGVFRLPKAEYEIESNQPIYYIGHLAKTVAEKIRLDPMILVSEVKDVFHLGLDKM